MDKRHAESSASPIKPEYASAMHREMVAVAAYYRAEHRGFAAGDPTADWLEAEAEIEHRLRQAPRPADSAKPSPKQAFQQKLETQLDEWDAKLEQLRTKAKEAKADIRAEFEVQLEALAAKRAVAQDNLRELRQNGESAWEDLKGGADKAWKELREAIERAASRLK
jgi:chromosome segregation ATPase